MHKLIVFFVVILALMPSCIQVTRASDPLEEVDVVVSKANNTGPLTREEVRKIFMGERSSWPGGKHIVVLMFSPNQPERGLVLREVFKMNESEYTRYFLQAAFTGRVQAAPRDLTSAAQMKAKLAANPNAIGYLRREDIDDGVRVVLRLP